jgi:hypothetical protein
MKNKIDEIAQYLDDSDGSALDEYFNIDCFELVDLLMRKSYQMDKGVDPATQSRRVAKALLCMIGHV